MSAIATGADYDRQTWPEESGAELPGMLKNVNDHMYGHVGQPGPALGGSTGRSENLQGGPEEGYRGTRPTGGVQRMTAGVVSRGRLQGRPPSPLLL